MWLSALAKSVPGATVECKGDYEVSRIVHSLTHVRRGDLYFPTQSSDSVGQEDVATLVARGGAIVVSQTTALPAEIPHLRVPDARVALGTFAAALNGWPTRKMMMIGITGSAGKTTSAHLTARILEAAGNSVGLISNVANQGGRNSGECRSDWTTMKAPELQDSLAYMVASGRDSAVLEVSSQGLDEGRVIGCEFEVAAYTNVHSDHLDYHGSRANYFRSKVHLMEITAASPGKSLPKATVLNRDDRSFYELSPLVRTERMITYGADTAADVRATNVNATPRSISFKLRYGRAASWVRLPLGGKFNLQNALCASAAAMAVGVSTDEVACGLAEFSGVPGRMERVDLRQPFTLYIDYAHTPLRYLAVLKELRRTHSKRIIVVFGSSGIADHDAEGTGRTVADWANLSIITSEDPGQCDPLAIAERILSGVRESGADYKVILDRRAAIRYALAIARSGDVVVLAGKGPEPTMSLPHGVVEWDERSEAETALNELGW